MLYQVFDSYRDGTTVANIRKSLLFLLKNYKNVPVYFNNFKNHLILATFVSEDIIIKRKSILKDKTLYRIIWFC